MNAPQQEQGTMPLLEHLRELKRRVLFAVVGVMVALLATLPFSKVLFDVLARPAAIAVNARAEHEGPDSPMGQLLWTDPSATLDVRAITRELFITGGPPDGFLAYLKVGLASALLLAIPWLLLQVWWFVAPGLYRTERKAIAPFVALTSLAFITGVAFAYFIVLPNGLYFFLGQGSEHASMLWTLDKFLRFSTRILAAFGVAFQLPLVMNLLSRIGAVSPQAWSAGRPVALPVIFLLSAILTPPDVITQIAMAIPMVLLYEIGVMWSKVSWRRQQATQ